ncbi:MAG: DUF4307 domain-containing protein [Propionibacteriaceae bacterium]
MQLTEADRRRVAERYPPSRVPRWAVAAAVAVLAAGSLTWVIWAGTVHATPAVSGTVSAWTITSDRLTDVTLTVDRRDPSVVARCRVIVQAPDFETVGEVTQTVPATPERVVNLDIAVTTLRRGTSASLDRCWVS